MTHKKVALFGAAATVALFAMQTGLAAAAEASSQSTVTEVIVTANKRQENIQNVGMSIQAATGDKLTKMGITDTASLQKIVPGFVVTPNYYGTSVFTIRGVGFQDTSLASSPTVTVYADEAPLPFSVLSSGATLDLQRVEVLKGPQGTLFGNNATGGAINYIANKPTDTFQAGLDVTVGNFATANVSGFVSGPIAEGLDARIALQSNNSGAWQKGYGQMSGQSIGGTDFLNGRVAVQWKPNDKFKALLTLRGWQDKNYNQIGQYAGTDSDRNQAPDPLEVALPLAPHNDQAAMWNSCVNTSPFDPLSGQNGGTLYYTAFNPDGTPATHQSTIDHNPATIGANGGVPISGLVTDPNHGPNVESQGANSLAQIGGQPTHCIPPRNNNDYFSGTLRLDYDLPMGMTLTSLSEFQRFNRNAGVDGAGVPFNTYQSLQHGKIESAYQELRVAGKWWGKGNWIIGANYEFDATWDSFLQTYNGSMSSPVNLPVSVLCEAYQPGGYDPSSTHNVCTLPESPTLKSGANTIANPNFNSTLYPTSYNYTLGPTAPADKQITNTYAVYASGEYPILDNLTLIGGIRYTEEDKKAAICGQDGGDGTWALDAQQIANLSEATSPFGATAIQYGGASQTNPINGYISPIDAYLNGAGNARNVGPHGCAIMGPAPDFQLYGNHFPTSRLNEHNISWKAGLNWKVQPRTLLYVTFSQGYKGGAFPTIAETTFAQNTPAKQESLLSYEFGFKGSWFDNQLSVNGAGFYYDYHNKQILGAVNDPVFGPLAELVNVPKSHVIGWELSGIWTPEWLKGLTVSPAVAYQYSKIDPCTLAQSSGCIGGHYHTTSPFPQATDVVGASLIDVNGEGYPDAPVWGASVDVEYDWKLPNDINAFAGVNVNFTGSTYTAFTWQHQAAVNVNGKTVTSYNDLAVPAYTLLDLRAGISKGAWRFMVWGHNVTNTYYWTSYDRVNDTNLKYTGMPTTYGLTISYKYQ